MARFKVTDRVMAYVEFELDADNQEAAEALAEDSKTDTTWLNEAEMWEHWEVEVDEVEPA